MIKKTTYKQTVKERRDKAKQALIDVFKEMPVIQVAVKKVGISRDTYYRWKKEDKNFFRQSEDAFAQGIEFINDMSESQIITLIKEKKMPAITLWVKHNHPRYGGSNTQSYTAASITKDLSPEEKKLFIEALKLASGSAINKKHKHHENK
jgi:hypothetical protein